jgi:hypothetical protein
MAPDCPGCAPAARPPRARAPWVAVASAALAALAPKCPLCLAAYLSAFGVTVGAASVVVAVLRPLAVALAVLAVAIMAVRRRGARTGAR